MLIDLVEQRATSFELKTLHTTAGIAKLSTRLASVEAKGEENFNATQTRFKCLEENVQTLFVAVCPCSDVGTEVLTNGINALKRWTDKASAVVIYDSAVDPFTQDGLFDKVKGKENVAVVASTTDGDVFGGFYSQPVTEQDKECDDPDMFIFSFLSHGRCKTPKRFVTKFHEYDDPFVLFWNKNRAGWFVDFGVGGLSCLSLGNVMSNTKCYGLSDGFENIEDTTLTGKSGDERHFCARLVAIHLE